MVVTLSYAPKTRSELDRVHRHRRLGRRRALDGRREDDVHAGDVPVAVPKLPLFARAGRRAREGGEVARRGSLTERERELEWRRLEDKTRRDETSGRDDTRRV